jgi:small subunit ribosomal protein S1
MDMISGTCKRAFLLNGFSMTDNTNEVGVETEAVAQVAIGEIMDGVVVQRDGDLVIELGGITGHLSSNEGKLELGHKGPFLVETFDGDVVSVSSHKGEQLAVWDWIHAQIESGDGVEATVLSESRGGLAVLVNGLNGLLPEREFLPTREVRPQIGEVITVQISQYRDRKNHLFVSERALVEGSLEERKDALLADLEVGQVLTGEVRRFASFGAFVDLGGLDALLHVKDIAWRRIEHPRDALSIGDVLTLQVLDFDRGTEKVSVGAKQMIPDPWLSAEDRYPFNQKVRGRVVGMSKFGAFVMLDDGIEGLAHVSEMSWTEKIQSPREAVTVGDVVDCWVVRCETDRRRLALSLKDPDNNPWLEVRDSLPIGTERDFVITRVVDFGLFVELDGGLDGLIHVSDFSWAIYEGEPSDDYKAGQTVRAIMLDIDEERGRANLGIKQLCADLTTELMQKYTSGQRVNVKITSIQDHGFYASIQDGLEGFLPAGKLPDSHQSQLDEMYQVGQELAAVITLNDLENKRIELELAADADVEAPAVEAQAEVVVEVVDEVEAPAVEAPAVETQAEVVADVEAPDVEAPAVETQAEVVADVEAPAVETQTEVVADVEAPAVETQAEVVADVEAPAVEAQAEVVAAVVAEVVAEVVADVEAPAVEAQAEVVDEVVAEVETPAVEAQADVAADVETPAAETQAAQTSVASEEGTTEASTESEGDDKDA